MSKVLCSAEHIRAFLSDRGVVADFESFVVADDGGAEGSYLVSWNVPGVPRPSADDLAPYTGITPVNTPKLECTRNQIKAYFIDLGISPPFDSWALADDGDGVLYLKLWNVPGGVERPTAEILATYTPSVCVDKIRSSKFQCTPAQLKAFLLDRGVVAQLSGEPTDSFVISDDGDGVLYLSAWNVPTVTKPTIADLASYTDLVAAGKITQSKKDAYPIYSATLPQVEPRFDLTRRFLWEVLQSEFNLTKVRIAEIEKKVWDEWQDGTSYQ